MKAHIGVESKQGHVHSLCTSVASVANQHMLPDLLHGEERKVWATARTRDGEKPSGERLRRRKI